jgi:hypothetical protein
LGLAIAALPMQTNDQLPQPDSPGWSSGHDALWETRIRDLGQELAAATCLSVGDAAREDVTASSSGAFADLTRTAGIGAGDTTFGLDVEPERIVQAWAEGHARTEPLSVLTEDSGWRHLGPSSAGPGFQYLDGFDHGGPRVAIDPVDGTRNLMFDLRSAWASIALAPPGASVPMLSEVSLGYLRELPDSRSAEARLVVGKPRDGACRLEIVKARDRPTLLREGALRSDDSDQVDGGFFPFFRFHPDMREELAQIEATFFARLAKHEGADQNNIYDDQYISNAGQLLLLASSKYRMVADLRAYVAQRRGRPTVTSKPYDVAAAIPIARAAGCVVTHPDGSPLDFELNATTPVSFVAWANEPTRARLAPHLQATLGL